MEEQFKNFFPIFSIFLTWYFIVKNRVNDINIILVLFTFFSFENFSANYSFFYREAHQAVIVLISVLSLKKIIMNFKKLPVSSFFFLFLAVVCSYFSNNGLKSLEANLQVKNFITVALSTIWITITLSEKKDSLLILSKYIELVGFWFSLGIIVLFANSLDQRQELTFNNSNYAAFFLGISVGFMLLKAEITGKARPLYMFMALAAILFTGSRSILLTTAPLVIFYLFRNRIIYFIIAMLGAAGVFYLYFDKIFELSRLDNMEEDVSLLQRYEIRAVIFRMFQENPLFGIGWGQFIEVFRQYLPHNVEYIDKLDMIVTHNDYFRILAELGILGALVFLVILIRVLFLSLYKVTEYKFSIRSLVLIVLFYSYSHNNITNFVFWTILFLPFIITKNKQNALSV